MPLARFPETADDVTVRLIAALVLVIAVVTLASQAWWLYAVLAVDFFLRAVLGPRASPLARLVTGVIRPRVALEPRPTAVAPKRFAAAIGAGLTLAAAALWLCAVVTDGSVIGVVVIGAVMVLFPALEALAGVCVGCHLFALLMRFGWVPEEVCLDCADITRRQRVPATD